MQNHSKVLKNLDELIKQDLPIDAVIFLRKARGRLRLTMAEVVAAIPGDSVSDKAKKAGVTRQEVHRWRTARARPNDEQARVLAKLTGFSADDIRGA